MELLDAPDRALGDDAGDEGGHRALHGRLLQVLKVRLLGVRGVRLTCPQEGLAERDPVSRKDAAPGVDAEVLLGRPLVVGLEALHPPESGGGELQDLRNGTVGLPLDGLRVGAEGPDARIQHGDQQLPPVDDPRPEDLGEGVGPDLHLVAGSVVEALDGQRLVLLLLLPPRGASAVAVLPILLEELLQGDEDPPPPEDRLAELRLEGQDLVPALHDEDRVRLAGEAPADAVLRFQRLQGALDERGEFLVVHLVLLSEAVFFYLAFLAVASAVFVLLLYFRTSGCFLVSRSVRP